MYDLLLDNTCKRVNINLPGHFQFYLKIWYGWASRPWSNNLFSGELDVAYHCLEYLTSFKPIFHFYTLWRRPKAIGLPTFSRGTRKKHWSKMDYFVDSLWTYTPILIEKIESTKLKHFLKKEIHKYWLNMNPQSLITNNRWNTKRSLGKKVMQKISNNSPSSSA